MSTVSALAAMVRDYDALRDRAYTLWESGKPADGVHTVETVARRAVSYMLIAECPATSLEYYSTRIAREKGIDDAPAVLETARRLWDAFWND